MDLMGKKLDQIWSHIMKKKQITVNFIRFSYILQG